LSEIADKVAHRDSFAFESTLAGRGYTRAVPRWREVGYNVKIVFLSLPSVELAIARVRTRVAQGGHDVPESAIRRRFEAGLENFTGRS
jgi:predicted ABC-type ATPase